MALVNTEFYAPFAGRTVQFKIVGVASHASILEAPNANQLSILEEVEEYEVTWTLNDGTANSQPLCPGGSRALAVPNAWSTAGELLQNAKYFTFACVPQREGGRVSGGGAIAKCIDWGYPPWARRMKLSTGTAELNLSLYDAMRYHQTCVRMATADYCGEGKTNTLDGTPIAFADMTNVQVESSGKFRSTPTPLSGYYLEAIWGVDACGRTGILCLGKKRWDTLALDGTCTDFRMLANVSSQGPVHICETLTKDHALLKGKALLISYSTFIDRPLVRFEMGGTGGGARFLTTASVVKSQESPASPYSPSPDVGELGGVVSRQVVVEGPLISPDAMGAIVSLHPELSGHLKPLYRCRSAAGQIITVDEDRRVLCSEEPVQEGYIYGVQGGIQNNPLYLWRTGDGRYATSTHQPAAGYGSPELLGYLPPLSQLAERALELAGVSPGSP